MGTVVVLAERDTVEYDPWGRGRVVSNWCGS